MSRSANGVPGFRLAMAGAGDRLLRRRNPGFAFLWRGLAIGFYGGETRATAGRVEAKDGRVEAKDGRVEAKDGRVEAKDGRARARN